MRKSDGHENKLVGDPKASNYWFTCFCENFGFIMEGVPDSEFIDKPYEDTDPPSICITGFNLDRVSCRYNDKERRYVTTGGEKKYAHPVGAELETIKCKSLLLTMSFIKSGPPYNNFTRPIHRIIRNCEYHQEDYGMVKKIFVTKGESRHFIEDYNLKNIMDDWWPNPYFKTFIEPTSPSYPDTPRKRAELSSMLKVISSDCSYDRYRDVVWGILSTGWSDAEEIAKKWCITTPERFEAQSFDTVIRSYNANHNNPITIGSIKYWAREGGWT